MNLNRRRFITITAGCLLSAHHATASGQPGARWQGIALGAHADLRLVGLPSQTAQRLLVAARKEIDRLENQFSLYQTNSALVRLNAEGSLPNPSPEMRELCSIVSAIHQASSGLFDPSIQPLWAEYARTKGRPDLQRLELARSSSGWHKVEISSRHIRLAPDAALTFNGIAQGYITDKVVGLLKAEGLQSGLVSVGEISAVGQPPTGGDWKIGLADTGDGAPDASVNLNDKAIATSSPTGTLFAAGMPGHILNPQTGATASTRWRRVSVLHKSAAVADGLSTACVLQSVDAMRTTLSQFAGATAIAIDENGNRYNI